MSEAVEQKTQQRQDQKIKVSVQLSSRVVSMIDKEAKRVGVSFSDVVRRIADNWADNQASGTPKHVFVLDRQTGEVRQAR